MMTLTSTDFSGLFNQRFFQNFLPIPATNLWQIGDVLPNLELPDITNNRTVKLTDYQGKTLVLSFTRIFTEKQYCPLCFPHIQALNANYEQFKNRDVEVLMITSTDAQQSQKVVQDLGLKLPLLSDPACNSFRAYGVGQALGAPLPAQFVVSPSGRLQYKHLFSFFEPNASIEKLLAAL